MEKCDFCKARTDEKLVLRDKLICKKDGSDLVVCSTCLDLYINCEFNKLIKRVKNEFKILGKKLTKGGKT
jgi:hypothetical protein